VGGVVELGPVDGDRPADPAAFGGGDRAGVGGPLERSSGVARPVSAFYVTQGSSAIRSLVALVGYARVSTRDQHPEAQTDALTAAGCAKVFVDHASGTLAKRPALEQVLDYLRPGDTVVVTKLDRLGRSVRNLKALADELQARDVGLRALSQGSTPPPPAAGCSSTCSPRSPSSSTT